MTSRKPTHAALMLAAIFILLTMTLSAFAQREGPIPNGTDLLTWGPHIRWRAMLPYQDGKTW